MYHKINILMFISYSSANFLIQYLVNFPTDFLEFSVSSPLIFDTGIRKCIWWFAFITSLLQYKNYEVWRRLRLRYSGVIQNYIKVCTASIAFIMGYPKGNILENVKKPFLIEYCAYNPSGSYIPNVVQVGWSLRFRDEFPVWVSQSFSLSVVFVFDTDYDNCKTRLCDLIKTLSIFKITEHALKNSMPVTFLLRTLPTLWNPSSGICLAELMRNI